MLNKKNLLLLIILAVLIVFAYFHEEVGKEKKEIIKVQRKSLIKNFDEVNKISFKSFDIVKKNNAWSIPTEKRSLATKKIEEILKILSNLKIEGKIDKKESISSYFNFQSSELTLLSESSSQKIKIGDVSEITGNFYVLVNDKDLFICSDQSIFDSPYKTELDLQLRKYLRLKKVISSSAFDLQNKSALGELELKGIVKLKVDGKRNRWFELDLLRNKTRPAPYKGLGPKELRTYVIYLLEKFKLKSNKKLDVNLLSGQMGMIEIVFDSHEVKLELYASYNGVLGRYIHNSKSGEVLSVEDVSMNIFHMNIQDFWKKTFKYDVNMLEINDFGFELSTDDKKYHAFSVTDAKESFKINSLDKKVEFTEFKLNFLFNLLFNLVDFKEAKYVEEKINIKNEDAHIYIRLFGRKLSILKNKNLITVLDHQSRLKYFFNYNSQQLEESFFQTIFTVGQK